MIDDHAPPPELAAASGPKVSIIVNTLNRAESLSRTIDSFRWLDAPFPFEVVVVNGPSNDRTDEVIVAAGESIRACRCPVANLSTSRNIGICAAAGDLLAFIDDDGIPEPEWLAQLVAAFEDPSVAGAGGFVFNHTGRHFQYRFGTADRLGNARTDLDRASPELNFPFTFDYPHLLGTNACFRKTALLEIGGFDEEYEYFLDETDVIVRLVDAGYTIAQLPNAYVHHSFAPSHLRNHRHILKNRFPVLKNKTYFCIKHGRRFVGFDGATRAICEFFDAHRREVRWLIGEGLAEQDEITALESTFDRAFEHGIRRGLANDPVLLRADAMRARVDSFRPFETFPRARRRSLVLLSADYPPNRSGGIATFTADLAYSLANMGHVVHVVTRSTDFDRVDFEHGVWIHRVVSRPHGRTNAAAYEVPQRIWDWSASAHDEVRRIATHRRIDCVEAPIWDCEGIAFILDRRWPVVISLQTTFHFWLDSHPTHQNDPQWMASLGAPMLALEKFVLERADGIRAISQAIRDDIEAAYALRMEASRVHTIPLGVRWLDLSGAPFPRPSDELVVLFVGRLEKRKGIDVLLDAIPLILRACAKARFRIVGDDTIVDEDGKTFRRTFEDRSDDAARSAVSFEGRLDDRALESAYATCDIFVAPSRYESFGLVYLEAMRAGKPLVGCEVGGVPEVVDACSGILVPPGNVQLLAAAVVTLASDAGLRSRMGQNGRMAFERRFTATRMAKDSLALYDMATRTAREVVPTEHATDG